MDGMIKDGDSAVVSGANTGEADDRRGWLNRNVLAFGLTSLLGDICHEMATEVLPQFMRVIGSGAAALGHIRIRPGR